MKLASLLSSIQSKSLLLCLFYNIFECKFAYQNLLKNYNLQVKTIVFS